MINAISSQFLPAINWINYNNSRTLNGNSNFDDLFTSIADSSTIKKIDGRADKVGNNILDFTQQILMNIENQLESFDSSSIIANNAILDINTVDVGNTAYFESILSNSGPLPTFLHEVDIRLHLNASKRQALRDIAAENMNATKTPESIQKIAMELQRAGIG